MRGANYLAMLSLFVGCECCVADHDFFGAQPARSVSVPCRVCVQPVRVVETKPARPAAQPTPAKRISDMQQRASTGGGYSVAGKTNPTKAYTIDHLMGRVGRTWHKGHYSESELRSKSASQLVAEHTAHHRRLANAGKHSHGSSAVKTFQSFNSNCPGGVCPAPRRIIRRRFRDCRIVRFAK